MNNNKKNAIRSLSDRIELPVDVLCGAPMIEMYSDRQLVIEGQCRITHYEAVRISAICRGKDICIKGSGLNIKLMNCDALIISGNIDSISFGSL